MASLYDYSGDELIALYSTPEMYGAVGDGIVDDTVAFQSALTNENNIKCGYRKTYKITAPLRIKENTTLDLNSSTIQCTDKHVFFNFLDGDSYSGYNGKGNICIRNGIIYGGCISFIHGKNITLENVSLLNTLNDHFMEICACKNYKIINCVFSGMQNLSGAALEYINIDTNASYSAFPHNKSRQTDPVFYDMSVSEDILIRDCYFNLGEGTLGYGYDAIGAHGRNVNGTYTKNVTIQNNIIKGFTGYGLRINAMDNAIICNNQIEGCEAGIDVGSFDSKHVSIFGNHVRKEASKEFIHTGSGGCVDLNSDFNLITVMPS